jgi:hypothetical protein
MVRSGVHQLCKDRGWHHGVPIMSATDPTRRVILAKGCPLADKHGHDVPVAMDGMARLHVCSDEDVDETASGQWVVNAWKPTPKTIVAVREKGKYRVKRFDDSRERINLLLDTALCQAGAVDSDSELKAMMTLKGKINDCQWDSYILAGCFPETSLRSHVTYILRKGLPTIAMRCRPNPDGPGEIRSFLAALCSHPLGYFEGTHAGAYPPSDEVIATLLSIRADEAKMWAKSNQHSLNDPLAGI